MGSAYAAAPHCAMTRPSTAALLIVLCSLVAGTSAHVHVVGLVEPGREPRYGHISSGRNLLQVQQVVSGGNMLGGNSVTSTVLNATRDGGFLVVSASAMTRVTTVCCVGSYRTPSEPATLSGKHPTACAVSGCLCQPKKLRPGLLRRRAAWRSAQQGAL